MIVALLLACLAAPSEPLARIELEAPGASPFLLQATLPVPPDADLSALEFEDQDSPRTRVPAQVEIVARDPLGRPRVVQVLARLHAPTGVADLAYDLHAGTPAPPAGFVPAQPVPSLLLRAEDVFGHRYTAELSGETEHPGFGARRWIRNGRWLRERKLAAVMVPTSMAAGVPAPQPHLMGVHAYWSERAGEECLGLTLRIHNGLTAGTATAHALEAPVGALYWKSLELLVPREWSVIAQVRDPFFGAAYDEGDWRVVPLVKPNPDGSLHFMPPQFQFHRRLALVRAGAEAQGRNLLAHAGLGFAAPQTGRWSWYEPALAAYFPQAATLASADFYGNTGKQGIRARETARMRAYARAIETGEPHGWYTRGRAMGWARPWFVPGEGGPGGEGISLIEGHYAVAGASRAAYLRLELVHQMNASRQSEAVWDRFGEAVGVERWLDDKGVIPFDFRTHGLVRIPCFTLPYQWGAPVSEQVRAVHERGLRPGYDQGNWHERNGQPKSSEDNLLYWWPHDDQHWVRWTKQAKALAWLGNDALAKDDLCLSAELFRLMFHENPHTEASWSKGITLRVHQKRVRAHPHQGTSLGREHAWGIDAACAAYALSDDAFRRRFRPWFHAISQLFLDAELPNGLLMRNVNRMLEPQQRWVMQQSFESMFLTHAMRCINETVLRGVDDARRVELEALVLRGIETLYFSPLFQRIPNNWQPDPANPTIFVQGPRQVMAVSRNDDYATPPFSDASVYGPHYQPEGGYLGNVEYFHCAWALDYAARLAPPDQAERFRHRILDCGVPDASYAERYVGWQKQAPDDSYDNSSNWVEFAGWLQRSGLAKGR